MRRDGFDTPPALADRLVELVEAPQPALVADFAAGSGALLAAAAARWPTAALLANDADRATAKALRAARPTWSVGACDFTRARSRGASGVLRASEGRVDVALLNPPFSDRGGQAKFNARLAGQSVMASRAVAFVLEAVGQLAPAGELAAILPAGADASQRDRAGLHALEALGPLRLELVEGDSLFRGCRLRVALLHFALRAERASTPALDPPARPHADDRTLAVVRGQVNATTRCPGALPLVHTTCMNGGEVTRPLLSCDAGRLLSGPLVLIPRVGTPRPDKLAVWADEPLVLSDCVIAITGLDVAGAEDVRDLLVEHFGELRELYGGSCARYVTLTALTALLNELGVAATPVTAPGAPAHTVALLRGHDGSLARRPASRSGRGDRGPGPELSVEGVVPSQAPEHAIPPVGVSTSSNPLS